MYNNIANGQKLFASLLRDVQTQKHPEHNYNINKFFWEFFIQESYTYVPPHIS